MKLGSTNVGVSTFGFGAAGIGNLYNEVSDADAEAALQAAWEAGVRYFDTAPHYGLGLSERRLGKFLAGIPRDSYVVSTKVGRLLEPSDGKGLDLDNGFAVPATQRRMWDFSADGVRRSVESSLERLGLDRVDVLLLHDPDDHWAQAAGEGAPALADLRSQGAVGAIGVGMNQWQMPARFIRETSIDVVMLAGRYTLLEQSAAGEFLPLCAERGVSVLAAGVFNSGLLARPQVADDAKYNYAPAPRDLVVRAQRIAAVCERHGATLPQAAVQFVLRHPAVASVVLGVKSADQAVRNAELFAAPVPEGLWDDLRAEGFLDAS
ncbi:D-threo-aldose 1-dehydrogenase [Kibdelosporangium banguiense]|uniref:D-threo-aldose 1-dehydrogenase n=1 Tax=Kibdelosporangium banguiense TaxID=1365924 RepID=A0ABS4U123_9PSEU|nr:aldo/keto reductase [Kibdelosporangium banguiense]MBP2329934.1 D-threo-aldose 1-dehydrogenase [Kibdelosporangium banguiense]